MPDLIVDDLVIDAFTLAREGAGNPDHRLRPALARLLGLTEAEISDLTVLKRSVDARRRGRPKLLYRVRANVARLPPGRVAVDDHPVAGLYDNLTVRIEAPDQPLVVGCGPAGLFCAWLLARAGRRPLLLERGRDVERRAADLAAFHASRVLDPESNYLVGEGGAGTYSDGKLHTRLRDPRVACVLDALVAARAPAHIRHRAHPHVGSDILPHVVRRLREQILAWGGTVRFGAHVASLLVEGGACAGVVLADGEHLRAPATILAVGHSARPLIRHLAETGVAHAAKGWQLGCRIEHPQAVVDQGRWGCTTVRPVLGAAEYQLVSRPRAAATVTSFCMCPGGEIIAGSGDPGQLSTNGMSRYRRAGAFANAALVCGQEQGGLDAFDRIAAIERAAFAAGGGDWTAPAQSAPAFLRGEVDATLRAGSYAFGVRPARLDRLLPGEAVTALRAALRHFDREIPGFINGGVLVGVETRVSSPLRFERDPITLASSLPGLWLGGEGAGWAGGIISAAVDGLKIAEALLTGSPLPLSSSPAA